MILKNTPMRSAIGVSAAVLSRAQDSSIPFGEHCTAFELMFWYWHAEKVAKMGDHAWGSATFREAAQVRHSVYGHYGHRR